MRKLTGIQSPGLVPFNIPTRSLLGGLQDPHIVRVTSVDINPGIMHHDCNEDLEIKGASRNHQVSEYDSRCKCKAIGTSLDIQDRFHQSGCTPLHGAGGEAGLDNANGFHSSSFVEGHSGISKGDLTDRGTWESPSFHPSAKITKICIQESDGRPQQFGEARRWMA
ncbi:hypothetical protein BDM02DRAFT_3130636 [Thelephora ganbajun]|uniref:Uncharacterized protein n=1 Tax=Thelephora ganbajun TaxID=370292 RepID=A0ACB6Z9B5_THEGA|nr:hypothetical protein BDM02DRAFT_3130636 [Thelephora ganbajun]